jgi:hypothetical protein
VGLALVGDLADDLDSNVGVGGLRVDVCDADLGIMEVEVFDAVIDRLRPVSNYVDWSTGRSRTFCPTQTWTFSSSAPETNCERLL